MRFRPIWSACANFSASSCVSRRLNGTPAYTPFKPGNIWPHSVACKNAHRKHALAARAQSNISTQRTPVARGRARAATPCVRRYNTQSHLMRAGSAGAPAGYTNRCAFRRWLLVQLRRWGARKAPAARRQCALALRMVRQGYAGHLLCPGTHEFEGSVTVSCNRKTALPTCAAAGPLWLCSFVECLGLSYRHDRGG